MRSLPRLRWLFALLFGSGLFVISTTANGQTGMQIRSLLQEAERLEAEKKWEEARIIYEALLGKTDPSLKIRERYHNVTRRCWQTRRHNDPSYRQEVLSIDFGQAMELHKVVTNTLLEKSIEKGNLTSNKLFQKGLEELDLALADQRFLDLHVPASKHAAVAEFRQLLKKTWGNVGPMTRQKAAEEISNIATAAWLRLNLNETVVAMEMACGACYAIDEYTVYLTPNQLRELTQALSRAEAVGVGMVLSIRESKILVHRVIPDSPADRSDDPIQPGDEIISVNKKAVVDLPVNAVRKMLEGPVGSVVQIELLTPGETNTRTVMLARQRPLHPDLFPPIQLAPSNPTIFYLKITHFTDTTAQDLQGTLVAMSRSGMKGLIVDLRGNGGGVFESAIDVAGQMLPTGIITSTVNQDTKKSRIYESKNPNAFNFPLIVLVDGETASAAEVLAGALKDNERAILIGQTTFGKGCSQRVLRFANATGGVPTGGMKLTVERFFSPKGIAYSGRGVVPHILIDDSMEPASQSNMMGGLAMNRAIEELNRMMAMQK